MFDCCAHLLPGHLWQVIEGFVQARIGRKTLKKLSARTERMKSAKILERETGFEPATLALARRCSTTELFPLDHRSFGGVGFY